MQEETANLPQDFPKKKQNRPLWECANCSISCAKIQQHMAQPDKIEFHSSLLFIGWMHYVIANIAVL